MMYLQNGFNVMCLFCCLLLKYFLQKFVNLYGSWTCFSAIEATRH